MSSFWGKSRTVRRRGEGSEGLVRAAAAALVAFFLLGGAHMAFAQSGEIYSPCWAQTECLDVNVGGTPVAQPNRGLCDNQHCFEAGGTAPACPAGQGKCYANPPPVTLTTAIGGKARVIDIGDYIATVYNYGVAIVGVIAGVIFVVAGFQYLTAGGDAGRVSKAKERIKDALIGLLLTLGAYVILNTVNPDVLRLQMPKVPLIKKVLFVACQYFEETVPCGMPFTLVKREGASDSDPPERRYRMAVESDVNNGSGTVTTQCIGKSCSRAGSDDARFRCKRPPGASASANVNASSGSSGIRVVPGNSCAPSPTAPYQCLPCTPHGDACTGSGRNQDCCGGYCVGGAIRSAMGSVGAAAGSANITGFGSSIFRGLCSNGNNGIQCGVDGDCFSRHCANVTGSGLGGICVSGREGSPCSSDDNCESPRKCIEKTGINVCATPGYFSACNDDNDCAGTGLRCNGYRCGGSYQLPCDNDSDCTESSIQAAIDSAAARVRAMMGSSSFTAPALAGFQPMRCWTKETHIIGEDDKICKPYKPGAVCHVGDGGNGDCEVCFDGAIQDRAIISPSAGICVNPTGSGGGTGCDNTSECQRVDPRSVCRVYQGYGNRGCTYIGTAGKPCVGANTGNTILGPIGDPATSNTCGPGLTCPTGVFKCVAPPSVCSGGGGGG